MLHNTIGQHFTLATFTLQTLHNILLSAENIFLPNSFTNCLILQSKDGFSFDIIDNFKTKLLKNMYKLYNITI